MSKKKPVLFSVCFMILVVSCIVPVDCLSQIDSSFLPTATITLDGDLADWKAAGISPLYTDSIGDNDDALDQGEGDIRYLYYATDSEYLYWAIETLNPAKDDFDSVFLRFVDGLNAGRGCSFSIMFWFYNDTTYYSIEKQENGEYSNYKNGRIEEGFVANDVAEGRIPLDIFSDSRYISTAAQIRHSDSLAPDHVADDLWFSFSPQLFVMGVKYSSGGLMTEVELAFGDFFDPSFIPNQVSLALYDPNNALLGREADLDYEGDGAFWGDFDTQPIAGTYTAQIRVAGTDVVVTDIIHNVRDLPRVDKTPLHPSGQETVATLTPTISWNHVFYPGATLYYMVRIRDAGSSKTIYKSPWTTDNSVIIPADELELGKSYRFRVETMDGPNWWNFENRSKSDYAYFNTPVTLPDTDPPVVLGLSSDSNPCESKTWTWSANENATFRYAIDQNPDWEPAGEFGSVTTASKSGVNGTWYLHVQAKDAAGYLSQVVTVSATFYIPLKIDGISPSEGAVGQDLDVVINGKGFDQSIRVSMSLDIGNTGVILAEVGNTNDPWRMDLVDRMLYAATGSAGIMLYDVNDPARPEYLGSVNTAGRAMDIVVQGQLAYVANDYGGLVIIDVSDHENPVEVGSLDTPGEAWGVDVKGTTVYIADSLSGLQIVDASDPGDPRILSTLDTPGRARDVCVIDDIAYVADHSNGLVVVDVSDTAAPSVLGSLDPGMGKSLQVFDGHVYLVDWDAMHVIDVSDPAHPQLTGSVAIEGEGYDISIIDSMAYLVSYNAGMTIIDITDKNAPIVAGFVDTPGSARGIAAGNGTVFVNDRQLLAIDVSHPETFEPLPRIDTYHAFDLSYMGAGIYALADWEGLKTLDLNDPENPHVLGSVSTPSIAQAVAHNGTLACVADWVSGMQVIDVSNVSSPLILGAYDSPGYGRGVAMSGGYAYLTDGTGLHIIDLADLQHPELAGTVGGNMEMESVIVDGNRAYATGGWQMLEVFDISDPQHPQKIGGLDGRGEDLFLDGNLIYIACGYNDGGMQIVDVSNPSSPILLAGVDTPGEACAVTVQGKRAYIADGSRGIQLIDVSDPTAPFILATVNTIGEAEDVEVVGSSIYVADSKQGVVILPIPVEIEDITVTSEGQLSLTLPAPAIPGDYTIEIVRGDDQVVLREAFTFKDYTGDIGDIDDDGLLTILDVVKALAYATTNANLEPWEIERLDVAPLEAIELMEDMYQVKGDGRVTIGDAMLMLQGVVGTTSWVDMAPLAGQ